MFTRCTARATRNVTPQRAGKPDCPELYSPRDWDSHSPCLPSASHPDCSCLLPAAQPLPAAGSSLPLCLLCFSFTAGLGDIILCWNIHVPNGCFSFAALVTFETTALNMNSVTCENLYMHILNMSHFIANIQSGGGMFVCLFFFSLHFLWEQGYFPPCLKRLFFHALCVLPGSSLHVGDGVLFTCEHWRLHSAWALQQCISGVSHLSPQSLLSCFDLCPLNQVCRVHNSLLSLCLLCTAT